MVKVTLYLTYIAFIEYNLSSFTSNSILSMANPNVPQSREAQLAQGQTAFTKISGLKDFYEPLPSKPYPKILQMAGVKIELMEYPTVQGGATEVVAYITKSGSSLKLCRDGRIQVNGYDDVQSIDPDMYAQAIGSVEKCIATIIAEQEREVEDKTKGVRKELGGFLSE